VLRLLVDRNLPFVDNSCLSVVATRNGKKAQSRLEERGKGRLSTDPDRFSTTLCCLIVE